MGTGGLAGAEKVFRDINDAKELKNDELCNSYSYSASRYKSWTFKSTASEQYTETNIYFFGQFWLISHQQDLPRHKGDQTNHRGYGLEGGHYFCVWDVVDGVEDDQIAGVGDGHQAEGDERGQPNHLNGKIHHNHNCQGQLTKYQPELQGDLGF